MKVYGILLTFTGKPVGLGLHEASTRLGTTASPLSDGEKLIRVVYSKRDHFQAYFFQVVF